MKSIVKSNWLGNAWRKFHNDEAGMETLQVVVIIAVAALIVLMLNMWVGNASDNAGSNTVGGWVRDLLDKIFAVDFTA